MQAKAGFDYQDTVTLLVLIEHFREHGASARVRPEGDDDLVCTWGEIQAHQRNYVQIKKPKSDALGNRKPAPWSLSEAADILVLPAIDRLTASGSSANAQQTYILGDVIDEEVRELLTPGAAAQRGATYLALLHLLAKDRAKPIDEALHSRAAKTALTQWRPPPALTGQEHSVLRAAWDQSFRQFLANRGIDAPRLADYFHELEALDQLLPDVLARIKFRDDYGTEQEVAERACQAVQDFCGISASVVKDTLFRNLRGFISDIAKIPDRWIDRQELELELRRAWPEMVLVRDPPPLGPVYIERQYVIQELNESLQGTALEVVGSSGSGKTLLASEWLRFFERQSSNNWTMYAQARPSHRLRDILAGLAFRLRRYGIREPFEIITRPQQSEEALIEALADAFSALPQQVVMLVDFIEGRGNDSLYHDLAGLLRKLSSRQLHFAFFAQEQVLAHLSPIEREMQGVVCFEPPGLQVEEFIELVHRAQPDQEINRTFYYGLFERASAHRTSGLLPSVAATLARASGTMLIAIQQRPISELLGVAERQCFDRIHRKAAAEKLLCFILPFRPRDAQQLFPEYQILAAAEEMRSLGLLRPHDAEHVEMHETVRNRLEQGLAPNFLKETHQLLARYYQELGQIVVAIAHFEKAGASDAARALARETYLRGEHQWELQDFIWHHRVLTGAEIAEKLEKGADWMYRELLRERAYPEVANILLQAIYAQPERLDKEYQWVWDVSEAILLSNPKYLYELTVFALSRPPDAKGQQPCVEWIAHAAGRARSAVDSRVLQLFQQSDNEIRQRLVQLLLHEIRRDVLKIAFDFLLSRQIKLAGPRNGQLNLRLILPDEKSIIEFLAALPRAKQNEQIADRSVQFGVFSDFIWDERERLRPVCRKLLAFPAEQEEVVLVAAMRVLLFLGDPEARNLGERFLLNHKESGFLQTLAMVAIAFHPQPGDRGRLGQLLLEPNLGVEDRITVAMTLLLRGESPEEILAKLEAADPQHARGHRFLVLMTALLTPFPEAIPLLEAELSEITVEEKTHIFAPIYLKISELPGQSITDALMRALTSPLGGVRIFALMGLARRRVHCAAEPIAVLLDKEQDRAIASVGLLAELASGPMNIARLQPLWERFPNIEYWRCVMIGRLRAIEEAPVLVNAATDPTKPWEVRRAAILAAGRLPYDAALAHLVEPVMRERSSFTKDNASLLAHSLLVGLLGKPCRDVLETMPRGQESFVYIWGHIFDTWTAQQMLRWGDEATGAEAIAWLYRRLKERGAPDRASAIKEVLNELHIPILQSAVLRALNLATRPDVIEHIALDDQDDWLTIRALVVHRRMPSADQNLPSRVRERREQAGRPISLRLSRIMNDLPSARRAGPTTTSGSNRDSSDSLDAPPVHTLDYSAVLRALDTGHLPTECCLILSLLDEAEFKDLVQRLDPKNDERQEYRPVQPRPALHSEGLAVHGVKLIRIDQHAAVRKRLRPLLAAINRFGIVISWHRALLAPTHLNSEYVKAYLQQIRLQNNQAVFQADLEQNGDLLLNACKQPEVHRLILPLINEQWVPALIRFSSIGSTELLQFVCMAASHITSPAIDPVLAAAFKRWLSWFDRQEKLPQHSENWPLWRAFTLLSRHPRFRQISGYEQQLAALCSLNLAAHLKQELISSMSHQPGSYIFIEQQLMKAASFEIYAYDEVDKLDDAADKLFYEVNEF